MSGFLDMGGYAAYVWPAYGLAAAVLVGMLAASLASWRSRRALLDRLEAARARPRRPSREEGEPS
jgi:heme exporter protein D